MRVVYEHGILTDLKKGTTRPKCHLDLFDVQLRFWIPSLVQGIPLRSWVEKN
jgi:hypothetical protein